MQRKIATRSLGVVAASVLLLAGCTQTSDDEAPSADQTSSGGDTAAQATSAEGASSGSSSAGQAPQVEDLVGYACALVADIDGSAQDWASGPDADGAEKTSLAAASDLLGAPSGTPLKGYDDLFQSAQTAYQGQQQANAEAIDESVSEIKNSCEEAGLPDGEVDISPEGRADFACSLVSDLAAADTSLEDWAATVGQGKPGENSMLLTEAFGTAGLLGASSAQGGAVSSEPTGGDELSGAAQQLQEGLQRLETDQAAGAIDSLHDLCEQR